MYHQEGEDFITKIDWVPLELAGLIAAFLVIFPPPIAWDEIETAEGPCVLAGARHPKNASPSVGQVYTTWDQEERFFAEWDPLELSLEQYLKKKQQKRDATDTSEEVTNEKEPQSEGGDEVMQDEIDSENVEVPEDADAGEENLAANGGGASSQKRQKKKK